LRFEWPSSLSVDTLIINGDLSSECLENVCNIPLPVESVVFDSVPNQQIYTLVEKLGYGIQKSIKIQDDSSGNLNLYRVLASCPNIESVAVGASVSEHGPDYDMSPIKFKNYKRFGYNIYLLLLKKFLPH